MTVFDQRYRNMSAIRLAELAADEDNLVPEAREALRAEIARRPPQIAYKPSPVEELASSEHPLDGVAGWLAWYCLNSFSAVYLQIRYAFSLRASSGILLAFAIFSLGIAAWDLATGISIMRRARLALRMVFIQLTIGALQGTMIMAAGVAWLDSSSYSGGDAAALIIAAGLANGAGYIIWFRYFQVSKRVKITFGRNL